jgi:hypothetical protein
MVEVTSSDGSHSAAFTAEERCTVHSVIPLPSEYGTYETVKARFKVLKTSFQSLEHPFQVKVPKTYFWRRRQMQRRSRATHDPSSSVLNITHPDIQYHSVLK